MPKVYGKRKKTKTQTEDVQELPSSTPRSLVLRRGKVGVYLQRLIKELRNVLYPFCAINLKESNRNSLKDFLSLVDVYGLSHMFAITNTERASYMRLAKMPSGPTITFKINKYCLATDIFNTSKNKKPLSKTFNHIPLCILNGFNNPSIDKKYSEAISIVSTMLQSIFPPLNLNELTISQAQKAIVFNLDLNKLGEPIIEMRHFDIDTEKASTKKTISNILNMKKQDLSGYKNIAEYILKQSGFTDCSDNEEDNEVNIIHGNTNKLVESMNDEDKDKDEEDKKKKKYGEKKQPKVSDNAMKVRLHEIGPRLSLSLLKIEEGFFKGNVAFHDIIQKSKKEILEKSKELKEKKLAKQKRREEQEENVRRKEAEKFEKLPEEKKQKIYEEEENKKKMLGHKRYLEKKAEKEAEKQVVMSKNDLKYLQNLKKGK